MKKKGLVKINGRELMVIGIIIAMTLVFCLLSPTFRTYPTLVSVLDSVYYVALMALGVSEEVAYEDSCKLEHHMSNETFEKIKEFFEQFEQLEKKVK